MPGDELDRRQAHKPPGEEENTKSLSGFKREGSLVNEPTKRVKVTKVLVSLRSAEYGRYGVVEGMIPGRLGECRRTECGVIARSWPSWAVGAQGAGVTISFIILFDDSRKALVERCFAGVKIVCINDAEPKGGSGSGWIELNPVDVVFTELDPPGFVNVWKVAQRTVVASRRCRRIPKGWKEKRRVVAHNECGGVTDELVHIHVYSKEEEDQWGELSLDVCRMRDVSGILDTRARQGVPCKPPKEGEQRFSGADCCRAKGETFKW